MIAAMSRQEYAFLARDGITLQTYAWMPVGTTRAVVVLTHGHGEYASKYEHVGQALSSAGIAVVAYDLRGHGRSGGPRGHSPKYEALLSDLQRVMGRAEGLVPDAPRFLYGHSFGGQITLEYVLQRRPLVSGVIVSGPWLRLTYAPPPWRMTLARGLAGLWPTFTQDTGLDKAVPMTHDTELLAAYPDPHLAHAKMTARLGMDAITAGEDILRRANEISTPLLVLHGELDGVFDPDVSRQLFERVATHDKALCVYPGMFHEIHNEVDRAQVIKDVITWIDGHLGE